MVGGLVCAVAVVIWWLFLSRAAWVERLGAFVLMAVGIYALYPIVHPSIAGGMMGRLLIVFSIPFLCLALVVWAVATHRLSDRARRAWLAAAVVIACAPWTLVRTAGVFGAGGDYHWRWTPTPEQLLLAQPSDDPKTPPPSTASTESAKEPPVVGTAEKPAASAPVAAAPSAPSAAKTAAAPTDEGAKGPALSEPEVRRVEGPALSEPEVKRRRASRMAWISWTESRRRRSWRAHRDRLVEVRARSAVAPSNRTGMVVLRGQRRSALHSGAAWRR